MLEIRYILDFREEIIDMNLVVKDLKYTWHPCSFNNLEYVMFSNFSPESAIKLCNDNNILRCL